MTTHEENRRVWTTVADREPFVTQNPMKQRVLSH
jgi:hypothetical protein